VDVDALAEFRKRLYKAMGEKGFFNAFEFHMKRKDGTVFPTEHSVTALFDEQGKQFSWVSVIRDITERKRMENELRESEEKFAAAFQTNPAPMAISNMDGRYVEINQAFSRLLGYSSEDVVGHTSTEVGNFVDPEASMQALELFRKQGRLENYEIVVKTKSGEIRHGLLFAEPLQLANRPLILTVMNDITERKRTQEAIERQNQQIQKVSRKLVEVQEQEKRLLATELHDDFGQSLTSLKLMLELASGTRSSATRKKELDKILELVAESMNKVRNLSLDLRPAMLDDFGLFAALRWFFERYHSRTGIAVHCNYNLNSDQRFEAHVETAAFRIIQEALTNVARHASVHEAQVTLAIGDRLSIEIADQGSGFDHAETAKKITGSGGVSGMQERARLLGGRVEIISEKGSGTRVRAEIPLTGMAS
jgi:PAS domain S-box-containing protein